MIYIDDLYTDELMTIGISPLNMAVNLLLQDGDILAWSPNHEILFQMACNMLQQNHQWHVTVCFFIGELQLFLAAHIIGT